MRADANRAVGCLLLRFQVTLFLLCVNYITQLHNFNIVTEKEGKRVSSLQNYKRTENSKYFKC